MTTPPMESGLPAAPGVLKREEKAWGRCETLLQLPDVAVFRLHFRAGGFTSVHFHARKLQNVTVVSGKLLVREFDKAARRVAEHLLLPGDSIYCPHNLIHQLAALTDTVCIETYCPTKGQAVEAGDIVRLAEVN